MRLAEIKGRSKVFQSFTPDAKSEIIDTFEKFRQNQDETKAEIYYSRMMKSFDRAKTDSIARQLAQEAKASQKSTESGNADQ